MSEAERGEAYERVMRSFTAFSATQKELARVFARSVRMHTTDADAIVLIIEAENRGRPLTPARLAERVGLSPGATSILLGRLEQAGHIERVRESPDRRIVTLRSTTSINASADAFFEPLQQQLGQTLGEFTTEQLALIARAADNLRAAMETYLRDSEPPD
ncbi:MarR family winged helix-turn-helix transcriptional regulator [Actinophytocola sp.]|uniref:MarR family winged helix-turn-helix transcriptional regulator n=1 Tax=Actinophytocola sp. TaxID=1872138 RepID=UPI002D55CCDC|nr:MarR family transcriptional regulator [Actinophytocola sp.]HYQ63975.1 MarR family transcriptional regulator [Actinophytocola sp.]